MSNLPERVRGTIENIYEMPGPMPEEFQGYSAEDLARAAVRVTKREILAALEEIWPQVCSDLESEFILNLSDQELEDAMGGPEALAKAAREAQRVIKAAVNEHHLRRCLWMFEQLAETARLAKVRLEAEEPDLLSLRGSLETISASSIDAAAALRGRVQPAVPEPSE